MLRNSLLVLLLFTLCGFILSSTGCAESANKTAGDSTRHEFLVREAELPSIPACPDMSDPSALNDETLSQLKAWSDAKAEHDGIIIPGSESFQDFTRESTRRLIEDRETSNFLYSPVSLWFCLQTLADLTEGESQAQLMQVIGQQMGEARDKQLDAVFQSLYWEDNASTCIPAMSVWLNADTDISRSLLERLAVFHTSVFQGRMGEALYDAALQAWLNEQTRELLKDSVSELQFSPDAALSVCSTLYYKNGWRVRFDKDKTAPDVFLSEAGEVTTDFMHSSDMGLVYKREGFTAVMLDFEDGGGVTFILPDAGVRPDELLAGDSVYRFLFSEEDKNEGQFCRINLSVPKMDCTTKISLRETLERMGIVDLFNPKKVRYSAELSSKTAGSLSVLQQYARLILNEDGVEAAAITVSTDGTFLMPPEDEIDFTLDRPFLYAVMSRQEIPLFIGMYSTP